MIAADNIQKVFQENGYKYKVGPSQITIYKAIPSSSISFAISMLIGSTLLVGGLIIGLQYQIVLSGFFFIGVPILFDRWRFPNRITINKLNDEIKLRSGFTYHQHFRLTDISGMNVDESVLSSDTSPFKEGYQDFVYSFQINVAKSKVRFMKFLFRKQSDEDMKNIFEFLKSELLLS